MPGTITLELTGWRPPKTFARETNRRVQQRLGRVRDAAVNILRETAPIAKPGSKPPGERPGGLRRGISGRLTTVSGGSGAVELRSAAPYTDWVLGGRGPITAAPGHMLRFYVGGRPVFRKRVGPQAPNDFIARALPRLENILEAQAILLRADLIADAQAAGEER